MSTQSLTEKQQAVLDFMHRHLREFDNTPNMRQIAEAFGWSSSNAATGYVKALIEKGYIERVGAGHDYRFKRRGK